MHRRSFLRVPPAVAITNPLAIPASAPELHPVTAGEDRFGNLHSLGFSELAFKVGTQETSGNLFVIEHRNLRPGGPPLHLHFKQEEWSYVVDGRVTFLVDEKSLTLCSQRQTKSNLANTVGYFSSVPRFVRGSSF